MNERYRKLFPLLMLAPWLLLFHRWSIEHSWFCGDVVTGALALLAMANGGHGQMWNPSLFGGMPLVGDIQCAYFYPVNWALMVFSPEVCLNLYLLFHLILAGLGMRWLLKALGLSSETSWVGGSLYSLAGTHLAAMFQPPQVAIIAWLPWCAWGAETALRSRSPWRVVRLVGLLALQFLGGFPQSNIYLLVALNLFILGRTWELSRGRPGIWARALCLGLLCPVIGLALAGIQWIPFLELMQQSPRRFIPGGAFKHSTWPVRLVLSYLCPWVAPPLGADPSSLEYRPYLGTVLAVLATLGTALRRRGVHLFWLACFVLIWLTAFEVTHVVAIIPLLNKFKLPLRLLHISSFFGLLLAMYAYEACPGRLRAGLAVVLLAEAFLAGQAHLPDVPIPDRLVSMPTPFQRIKNMAQEGVPYRFVTSRGCHSKFADLGMMYGLDSGTGVHSTPVYGWIELLSLNEFGTLPTGEFLRAASEVSFCFALNHLNSPLLRLMNVGWMIAPDPDDPQSHPAAPQGDPTGRESVLVRLPEPLPRAFLVSSAFIGDVPAQAARLVDPGWKPELEATLAEEPLPAPEAGGASECRILRNEPDTMTVQTSCERPKLLVISDVFYPGWEAEVNGRSQPILRVDVALRGVPLPAGTSLVTLRYKPRSLRWGFGLTLLTALLLLCYGLWGKLQEGAM